MSLYASVYFFIVCLMNFMYAATFAVLIWWYDDNTACSLLNILQTVDNTACSLLNVLQTVFSVSEIKLILISDIIFSACIQQMQICIMPIACLSYY